MKKEFIVFAKVGDFKPQSIGFFKTKEEAEAFVRRCEREDQYELKIGYGFPYGLPVYSIE